MRIHYISALFMIDLTAEELKQYFSDDIFKRISETADELGLECYVVGGYVRDIFLQRPSKDIDVVVVGSGIASWPNEWPRRSGVALIFPSSRISVRHN